MLPNSVCDPMYPSFDSSFEVIERDRKGGRTDRGIESRTEEDAGEERWRYGEDTKNTKVNIPDSNQLFIKQHLFFVYILCFIEIERREVTVKKVWKRKRRLSGGC